MRIHLKGIHKVRATLSTGTKVTYYYAWRGGPRLSGAPGSPQFFEGYSHAHADRRRPAEGRIFTLMAEFKGSAEFAGLASTTRKSYGAYFKIIEAEFGDMPIEALADPRVRGDFKAWRDRMANTPRKADLAWSVLARVLSVAKDRGRISVNPCERGGRLHSASRADRIWTDADMARVVAVAEPYMRLAIELALWTGQRQGDLLRLPWSGYDGRTIKLRQSKTGRPIVIPVSARLRALLDTTARKCPFILCTQRGRPWTSDGFRASWAKLCKRAGIDRLTFHDLRGSAVTRLALAGASAAEIAGVTGHSLADVAAILDRHYLGNRAALAESAIRKLEQKEKRTKAVKRL